MINFLSAICRSYSFYRSVIMSICILLLVQTYSTVQAYTSDDQDVRLFRVAVQNSVPIYIPAGTAGYKGLCDLIYEELGKRLKAHGIKLQIVTSPTSIQRIVRGLKTGMVDGFCGMGRNSERDKDYYFSRVPVFQNMSVLVAHRDDKAPPEKIDDLVGRGETIMALQGSLSADHLKKVKGIQVDDRFMNLNQPLSLIATRKQYKYFYYNDMAVAYLIRKNKLPLQMIRCSEGKLPQYMAFSKKIDPDIRIIVDRLLADMQKDKTLSGIQEKFAVD